MAVGRRPKLTMPILARINFLHKNDPNLFCILNSKWSKKIWSAHIWPVGSRAFDQNGPPHGALTKWDGNFFHKRYPLWILILYRKMFSNVKIGPVWADWPTPPFVQNGPHCSAANTWVSTFFHKTDPLWILILCEIELKIFQIGPFWADRQTPHFSKTARKMGPQIHELAIFCIKRTPFEFGFCVGNCSKFFKSVDCGPIGRPPNMSKTAHNMGPKIPELAIFFIKQTPF